jgi:hypothetical protein
VISSRLQKLVRGISSGRFSSSRVAAHVGIAARGKPDDRDEVGGPKAAKKGVRIAKRLANLLSTCNPPQRKARSSQQKAFWAGKLRGS